MGRKHWVIRSCNLRGGKREATLRRMCRLQRLGHGLDRRDMAQRRGTDRLQMR